MKVQGTPNIAIKGPAQVPPCALRIVTKSPAQVPAQVPPYAPKIIIWGPAQVPPSASKVSILEAQPCDHVQTPSVQHVIMSNLNPIIFS